MKLVKDRVLDLLTRKPHLRDSDDKLIANVWFKESTSSSKYGFLQELADGKLTNSESIRRTRQKIQQENPELRGKNYKERQGEQEHVKDQLREF